MQKILDLEGRQLKAVSNALLPRLYRFKFGKDFIMELQQFQAAAKKDPASVDYTPIENMTWLMFKEGGEDVGESPDEWLRSIEDPTAVYLLAPDIMDLWQKSQQTTSRPKKG